MPRLSRRPPKHSSAENIPCGWPWYASCIASICAVAVRFEALPPCRYHTAPHFVPIALFTPWSHIVHPPTALVGNTCEYEASCW